MKIHDKRETMKCAEKYAPRASSSVGNSASVLLAQSSREVRVEMDFQHRYYKVNKVLLKCIGQWPYQTTRARRSYVAAILFTTIGHMLSQIMACVKYRDHKEILTDCVMLLSYAALCLIKVTCSMWNSQKTLKLLNRIRTDWQVWAQDQEINILHRYAERGRKITIAYTVMNHVNGSLFMMQPVIPKIIDVLWKNGSKAGEYPIRVEYYLIDMQKYYFYLILYTCVCGYLSILVLVALDTIFIVYIQHACGIFAALGHKLERVGENYRVAETGKAVFASGKKDIVFEYLASCIDRHNNAIEYAELIEATYTWYFLCVVGLNMLIISLIGLQIIKKTNDLGYTIKFISWLVAGMVHLYIGSYMSQILSDHGISIRYYIYNSKWYNLSMKARKICLLMLMRCNKSCDLTAGKITIMSMRTFQGFLNTSVSYFMFLRSM